jgi:CheY-specific phosphatase CheX
MTIELGPSLKEACGELLGMFGIEHEIIEERVEDKLRSSKEVNIMLGITGCVKGNLLVGASKNVTLKIVSCMMGGMEFTEVDDMVVSGISEFTNMIAGTTITKLPPCDDGVIDISPPTVITSDGETTFKSQYQTHKIIYSVMGERLTLSYCIKS